MFRLLTCFLLVVLLATGCKKTGTENIGNQPKERSLLVLEAVTRKPIEGAKVTFKKCDAWSIDIGCYRTSDIITLTTNKDGKVSYRIHENIEYILIQHRDYWGAYAEYNEVSCTLNPKSTIKAVIKKVNSYSSTDYLSISVMDGDCYDPSCSFANIKRIGLPADTTVYIQGFGYKNNLVSWTINNSIPPNSLPKFYSTGFDTTVIKIEY